MPPAPARKENRMRKNLLLLGMAFLLLFQLSACSYVAFEQKLRGFPPADTDIESNTGEDLPEQFDIDTETDMEHLKLRQIGDEITINDGITEMSYRVDKVTVYDNFEEAGLTAEDMGYISGGQEKNPFVLLDITVKNKKVLQETADYNIAVFHLLNQKILNDPWVEALPEMAYFSGHAQNRLESEYFHYVLKKGGELQCQVGWILYGAVNTPEDLVLHVGANIEGTEFVDLNQEGIKEE